METSNDFTPAMTTPKKVKVWKVCIVFLLIISGMIFLGLTKEKTFTKEDIRIVENNTKVLRFDEADGRIIANSAIELTKGVRVIILPEKSIVKCYNRDYIKVAIITDGLNTGNTPSFLVLVNDLSAKNIMADKESEMTKTYAMYSK